MVKQKQWGNNSKDRRIRLSQRVRGGSNPSAKQLKITKPNGEIEFCSNVREWCIKNNAIYFTVLYWAHKSGIVKRTCKKDTSWSWSSKGRFLGYKFELNRS